MLFVVVVVTPPMCWLASINCLKVTKRQHSTFCLGSGDDRLLPIRSTAYLCQSGLQKILQSRKQIGYYNPVLDERTSDMERPVNIAELVAALRRLHMDTDVNLPLRLNFDECPQRPMAMSAIGQGVSCLMFVPKQPFKWNIKYQAFMKTKWTAYERSLLPVANVSTDAGRFVLHLC